MNTALEEAKPEDSKRPQARKERSVDHVLDAYQGQCEQQGRRRRCLAFVKYYGGMLIQQIPHEHGQITRSD